MNTRFLGLSLAALAVAGVAYAAPGVPPQGDPLGDKAVTKAEFLAKHGEMFDKMDANKDGKLDQADRAAHLGQMFDDADADHNGALSREEFAAAHQRKGPEGDQRGAGARDGERGGHRGMGMGMIRMADTNNDGAVTRAEFLAGAGQHFDRMDANKDGTLTAAERKAARAQMGGRHGGKRGAHGDHPMPPEGQ